MKERQRGFTLTELMISTGLSLSVISAVLLAYVATSTNAISTLAGSKLNHELTSLITLMSDDIRRAGYWGTALGNPAGNPFNRAGQTALTVFDSSANNNQPGPTGSGTCVTYAYDMNRNGVLDTGELTGFRLVNGAVQMRTAGTSGSPASCANASDSWENLTDRAQIVVMTLTFNFADSVCLNTREPDGLDNDGNGTIDNGEEMDCYRAPLPTVGSGDVTVETREVEITVGGTLVDDSFVRLMQSQTVRVRNELIRLR